jgi:ribonucleoside-diphosphate reductase alpha chain
MYTQEEAYGATLKYFNGDELAGSVFVSKYALRDSEGKLLEKTPEDMHRRLAREFARIEAKYPNPISEEEIFGYLSRWELVPQGSPMSAMGNPYKMQSLSNCFVSDSPADSYGGILFADQEQAQIMKRRGGVGFDISTIRPRGLATANAAGTTDGIGVFMERFSNTCREVAQGGRRGALMLTISVKHPEIETFINIKRDLKKVTGANISIRLTDDFMQAVKDDTEFNLQWPVEVPLEEASIVRKVRAKDIWDQIIDAAWTSAEPGLLFWDTVKRNTPTEAYKSLGYGNVSTNPCVTGDTIVRTNAGPKTVKELSDNKANFYVQAFDIETNEIVIKPAIAFKTKDNAKILQITTKSGKKIKLTPDHRVYTQRGWVEAGDLTKEDKILSF